jgi:N-acyl-D-aspartate/D-glutamate deacylase
MTRVSSELIKRNRKALLIGLMLALCSVTALTRRITVAQTDPVFDIVLANGRTMDPESSLDAIRHIGIRGGRIEAISASPLRGQTVIDARGLVVAPGFIDLHSHGQTDENYRFKARDGVTTALELEVGVSPVATWYTTRAGKARINFGATVGHIPARMAVTHDSGTFLPRDNAITRSLTQAELKEMNDLIRGGMDDGALGVGFGIAYVPAARREEVLDIFQLAADRQVPCFVHVRSHGAVEPGSAIESVQEVIADAAATGASLHIVHITSTGLGQTPICLQMIDGARRRGLDITTEAYPYTAAMTGLETAIFSERWQERMGIGYQDLQWAATGERLTAESFARYRKQGGMVVIHSIPEEIARLAVAHPLVMIASDGMIDEGKGHPRGAGTYARVLGRYVREEHVLTLMDALRKMTIMPAQRLEKAAPQMLAKGRIKVGADADITIFDPERVIDRATFENPAQFSEGILHVLVNGTFVVRDGKLVEDVRPGVAIRRSR